jgi:DNA polymerase III delta subunit
MVEPRVYLFLGQDEEAKQKRIEALTRKILPPEFRDLNTTFLYADEKNLTLADIGEVLACLPMGGAKQRLCVIKRAHKLSRAAGMGLAQTLRRHSDTVLVLDFSESKGTQDLVEDLKKAGAQVVRFKDEQEVSAFDLGRAIVARRPESALKILSVLLRSRDKAEKTVGAIFWQWQRSFTEKRFSQETYKRGLKLILDADKRLKTSSSAFARETLVLEALVVKLSYLV